MKGKLSDPDVVFFLLLPPSLPLYTIMVFASIFLCKNNASAVPILPNTKLLPTLLYTCQSPSKCLTIDEHDGFVNRVLIIELGVKESFVEVHAIVCALVPADVQVVHIHMSQIPHHLHLVVNCNESIA